MFTLESAFGTLIQPGLYFHQSNRLSRALDEYRNQPTRRVLQYLSRQVQIIFRDVISLCRSSTKSQVVAHDTTWEKVHSHARSTFSLQAAIHTRLVLTTTVRGSTSEPETMRVQNQSAWEAFIFEARSHIGTYAYSAELVRAPKMARRTLIAGDVIVSASGSKSMRRAIADVSRDLNHLLGCDASAARASERPPNTPKRLPKQPRTFNNQGYLYTLTTA